MGPKMTHHGLIKEGSRAVPAAEAVSGPGGPGASWRGVAGRVGAGCLTNEMNIQMDGGVLGLVLFDTFIQSNVISFWKRIPSMSCACLVVAYKLGPDLTVE